MSNTAPTDAIEFLQTSVDEMKDRASQRDNAQGERSMAKTVDMFNLLYGKDLSEEQGWAFMVLLKMVRGSQGNYRADDYVDAAAYCGLQGEAACKESLRERDGPLIEVTSIPGYVPRNMPSGVTKR